MCKDKDKKISFPDMKLWHLVLSLVGVLITALAMALSGSWAIVTSTKNDFSDKLQLIIDNQSRVNEGIIHKLEIMDNKLDEDSDKMSEHNTVSQHSGADIRLKRLEKDVDYIKDRMLEDSRSSSK